jgi:hypothetical protein
VADAKRTVGTSSSQWDLHIWHRCQADAEAWAFPDRHAAALWLKQFKADPISMAGLRSVMLQHGVGLSPRQTGDDKLLEEAAWLLSKGVLHVHRVPARRTAWNTGQTQASSSVAPASPRAAASQPAAPAKVAEEQDTFSSQTDGAATAAVLRSAAANGVPFCEECAKAGAARQAA